MDIVIRTDASFQIGTGHVMRCLALADYLSKQIAANIVFICRNDLGDLREYISKRGYIVYNFTDSENDWNTDAKATIGFIKFHFREAPDWLIVDHYALDHLWEQELYEHVNHLFVIDDLANRNHICDMLLDQNLFSDMDQRYSNKTPTASKLLLGPQFAILRNEFYEERQHVLPQTGLINHVLVFMGGSDLYGETIKVLNGLELCSSYDFHTYVIIGASNLHRERIELFCKERSERFTAYFQIENMAQFLRNVDIVIGAGGTTTWERCFLGVPSLTIIIAENQRLTTCAVADFGATVNLGWYEDVTCEQIAQNLTDVIESPQRLVNMSVKGIDLMGDPEFHGLSRILFAMENVRGNRYGKGN